MVREMIEVKTINQNTFSVVVKKDGKTHHAVTLNDETFQKLGKGKTKEQFIEKCFKFLLERESNQSILTSFNVKVISRYFPEFEQEVVK